MWCRVLHAFAAQGLLLVKPDGLPERSLALMLLAPAADLMDEVLTRGALLLGVAYRTAPTATGWCWPHPNTVSRAAEQAVKKAARGRQRATRCVDCQWLQGAGGSAGVRRRGGPQ